MQPAINARCFGGTHLCRTSWPTDVDRHPATSYSIYVNGIYSASEERPCRRKDLATSGRFDFIFSAYLSYLDHQAGAKLLKRCRTYEIDDAADLEASSAQIRTRNAFVCIRTLISKHMETKLSARVRKGIIRVNPAENTHAGRDSSSET